MPGLLNLQDPTTAYNKSVSGLPMWDPKYQQLTQKFQTDLGAYQKQQNDLNAAALPQKPVKTQPVWNEKYQQWMSPEMMPELNAIAPQTPVAATPAATATVAPVSTYTPTAAVQNPNTGTVQGQIDAITRKDSPLMQQAAQHGLDLANSRGLLNSGMAVQSAQNAVYDAALPIASADAASGNQFALINAEATNQANQFGAQQTNALNTTQANITADTNRFNAQQQNQLTINQLDQENKIQLANIQATYQNQMQTVSSSSALFNQVMVAINNIQSSTTMDAATKKSSVDQQMQLLKSGLSLQGAITNLNIADALDFSIEPSTPAKAVSTPVRTTSVNHANFGRQDWK